MSCPAYYGKSSTFALIISLIKAIVRSTYVYTKTISDEGTPVLVVKPLSIAWNIFVYKVLVEELFVFKNQFVCARRMSKLNTIRNLHHKSYK